VSSELNQRGYLGGYNLTVGLFHYCDTHRPLLRHFSHSLHIGKIKFVVRLQFCCIVLYLVVDITTQQHCSALAVISATC